MWKRTKPNSGTTFLSIARPIKPSPTDSPGVNASYVKIYSFLHFKQQQHLQSEKNSPLIKHQGIWFRNRKSERGIYMSIKCCDIVLLSNLAESCTVKMPKYLNILSNGFHYFPKYCTITHHNIRCISGLNYCTIPLLHQKQHTDCFLQSSWTTCCLVLCAIVSGLLKENQYQALFGMFHKTTSRLYWR